MGVDKMGVDEMGIRRSGNKPYWLIKKKNLKKRLSQIIYGFAVFILKYVTNSLYIASGYSSGTRQLASEAISPVPDI